jgi:hypothetical protein
LCLSCQNTFYIPKIQENIASIQDKKLIPGPKFAGTHGKCAVNSLRRTGYEENRKGRKGYGGICKSLRTTANKTMENKLTEMIKQLSLWLTPVILTTWED